MARKKQSDTVTPEKDSARELLTLIDPVTEICLEVALDILKLQRKVLASEQRLILIGDMPFLAQEVTEPLEHLDKAFAVAWESVGARVCARNQPTI